MNSKFEQWDIWLAEVKFEQDPTKSKTRPVLVIDNTNIFYIEAAQITSHEPREYDLFDYKIKALESCGLKKASTIRLDHKISLVERNMIKRIGKLSRLDIIQVQIILARRKRR